MSTAKNKIAESNKLTLSTSVFLYLKLEVNDLDRLPELKDSIQQYAHVTEAVMEPVDPGMVRLDW